MTHIFLIILNMGISACFVICAILLLRAFSGKAPKWLRCGLWILVAFRLICPFSFKASFSIIPDISAQFTDKNISENNTPASYIPLDTAYATADTTDASMPAVTEPNSEARHTDNMSDLNDHTDIIVPDRDVTANTPVQTSALSGDMLSVSHSLDNNAAENTAISGTSPVSHTDVLNIVTIIWLSGAASLLLYYAVSLFKMKKLVKVAVPLRLFDVPVNENRHNILVSDSIKTPFVLGMIKPRIYIPSGLDAATLPYVLEHEKKHIKRMDNIWKAFGFLLLAIHWFNPLVWLSYYLFISDVEAACDESVIRSKSREEIRRYALALLKCSIPKASPMLCSVAFGEISVKKRIRNIADYKKPKLKVIVSCILIAVMVTACTLTDPAPARGVEQKSDDITAVAQENAGAAASGISDTTDPSGINTGKTTDAGSNTIVNDIHITSWGEIAYIRNGSFGIDESLFDYSDPSGEKRKKDNIPMDGSIVSITDDDMYLTVIDDKGKIHSTYPLSSSETRENEYEVFRQAELNRGNVGTGRSDPDIVQDLEIMDNVTDFSGAYSYYYAIVDKYGRVIEDGSRIYSGETKAVQVVELGRGATPFILLENGRLWGKEYDNGDTYHNALKNWRCITKLYASGDNLLGLCMDGSVLSYKKVVQYRINDWTDIVDLAYGYGNIVGLDKNGHVLFESINYIPGTVNDTQLTAKEIQAELDTWNNVLAVDCNLKYIVGLTEDGVKILNLYKENLS
ncbi:MAG: hypothetical protein IJL20_03845 [Lachnospiraceae bacterium]|nr:hypothetical protein [Lachnospiraceae bacterium]